MATYDYSDKVVIVQNNEGGVGLLYPAPECTLTLEQIIDKDIPQGVKYQVADAADIPSDHTYFNSWIYLEN